MFYRIKVLEGTEEYLNLTPTKNGDVGYDVKSAEDTVIPSKSFGVVVSYARIQMPKGIHATMRGRSGLASKGIFAHNGTIDTGYTGHLGVILINMGDKDFYIQKGQRIGQIVFDT